MLDPHGEIEALVDNFIADLRELARRLAIEQVNLAFEVGANLSAEIGARPPSAAQRVAPVRVAGVTVRRGARVGAKRIAGVAAKPPAAVPVRASHVRRGKHETEHEPEPKPEPELEALRDRLLAALAEQPGRRIEDLDAALGTRTTQIDQLLRRLVTENLVRTEGVGRGTRYFAIVGDPRPVAPATAAASATAAAAVAVESAAATATELAAVAAEPLL
jgi:DNA-binding Lrp family transcriptional regulator